MATNPNLTFPNYNDWVSGGTYQVDVKTKKHSRQDGTSGHTGVNTKLDPNDKNMPGYYTNYQAAVTNAINAGKNALAKAIVTSHGQKWIAPVKGPVIPPKQPADPPADPPADLPPTVSGSTQGVVEDVPAEPVEAVVVDPFDMAKLTDSMDLSNKLTEIINTNSPLFKAAQTKAMQNMQRRGLVNSTLAQEAVMNSVINVALPIAQAEVNQLVTNLYYNTDWTNKQKMQANEAAYNKMLTQVQGRIQHTLQRLVGSQNIGLQNLKGAQAMDLQSLVGQQETALQQQRIKADLWAKYGDWVTTMATTEGADQEAWQNMLDMLKGAGGWPGPT